MREPQVEDPLHEHLCIAAEVQGVRVIDDGVVRVRIQQHRHITSGSTHLYVIRAGVTMYEMDNAVNYFFLISQNNRFLMKCSIP